MTRSREWTRKTPREDGRPSYAKRRQGMVLDRMEISRKERRPARKAKTARNKKNGQEQKEYLRKSRGMLGGEKAKFEMAVSFSRLKTLVVERSWSQRIYLVRRGQKSHRGAPNQTSLSGRFVPKGPKNAQRTVLQSSCLGGGGD